ncbi:hypothetical protein BYT27DRAFT_7203268 [Phlegmacium glaucopus]|nr:hypothetical protein BYT27DRAFT_7203268 [Phlegmacium glaucopus]
MPVEPTKNKIKRRTNRCEDHRFDPSHGRELELKRNRVEVSCAECRRLKIKCDKQIPCQSCQRRGCSALCPNGSLATGQGTRFVLAATEHLHRRISKLSGRIRQLEDALAALHAKHSTEVHPLLHEDLMQTDERDESDIPADDSMGQAGQTGQTGDAIDAFGTLSISENGISRFFGPTGGSESLLLANLDLNSPDCPHTPDSLRDTKSPSTVGDLSLFSQSFPFTPMGQSADVQEVVESHLPSYERTLALCETYFEQVAWNFRGVTRMQVIDDMLPVIYNRQPAPFGEDYSGPHDLALLFVVMAIGALVGQEPSKALGEHYHQISRVAISLQPVLEKPSIVTIQTLHLMSIYNAMSGSDLKSETSMEMTWSLVTLASHLSQTIGLHRDSARWGLTPKMVQRRRILFWDLFVSDVWQSLNTGRPPSFSLAYTDCSFPQYDTGKDGNFGSSFEIWQYRFAAECVSEVTARILTAEAPSYATIMELDRKVREFPLPEGVSSSSDDLAGSFQKCVLEHIRETVLMYIHRSFFAQAIIEQPINPLRSTYAPSFLAAYRASSTILKSIRDQFNMWPNSCSRFWTMWTSAFSAAVVFGTVVTRGPRSPLAQPAMAELEQACILFSKASLYSIRATKALAILTKLNEKARHALSAAQRDPSPATSADGGLSWNIKKEDTDDELSILAGHTRLVSTQRGSRNPSPSRQYNPSPPLFPAAGQLPQNISHDNLDHLSQPHPPLNVPSAYTYMQHAPLSHTSSSTIADAWVSPSIHSESRAQQYQGALDERLPYTYTSSTGHHQPENSSALDTYGWSNDPRLQHHAHTQSQRCVSSASSSSSCTAPHQLPSSQHQSPIHSHSPTNPPQQHQLQHHNEHQSQYHPHAAHIGSGGGSPLDVPSSTHHHLYPSRNATDHQPSLPPVRQQEESNVYSMYGSSLNSNPRSPVYPGLHPQAQPAAPNMDLANLGLASRDSRLDERWGPFITDSRLLEGFR